MVTDIKTFGKEDFAFVSSRRFKIDSVKEAFKYAKKGHRYRIIPSKDGIHKKYSLYISQKKYKPKEWKW